LRRAVAGNAIGGESAPLIIMIRLTKCTGGDVTADLYQNNLSLVIDIVNIVISIPAAQQTDEILVGFLLVKTS